MRAPTGLIQRGFSPALVNGLIWRGWQIVAVPSSVYLVSEFFTPELQGYYYTFGSLIALQSFFELGLFLVVVNAAAHEWSSLSLDQGGRIVGNSNAQSRLISLGRMIFKYYALAAGGFCLVVSLVGFLFLSRQADLSVDWELPWFVLVVFASLNLFASPYCSLLEGCGQISEVYKMRVWQSIFSTICGWVIIVFNGGLWALAAISSVQLVCVLCFFGIRYRSFFRSFLLPPTGSLLSWRRDVWPMQWRLAGSGIVNYFVGALFTPVMFHYQGPAVAGQMGMSLQLLGGIQSVALTWLGVRVPEYGNLVARRMLRELDRIWARTLKLSFATYLICTLILLSSVELMRMFELQLASRVLPTLSLVGFALAFAFGNFVQSFAAYVRAFKQEPMLLMSVSTSLLSGAGVFFLAANAGANGVVWWYCFVMFIAVVWFYRIWRDFRLKQYANSGV